MLSSHTLQCPAYSLASQYTELWVIWQVSILCCWWWYDMILLSRHLEVCVCVCVHVFLVHLHAFRLHCTYDECIALSPCIASFIYLRTCVSFVSAIIPQSRRGFVHCFYAMSQPRAWVLFSGLHFLSLWNLLTTLSNKNPRRVLKQQPKSCDVVDS